MTLWMSVHNAMLFTYFILDQSCLAEILQLLCIWEVGSSKSENSMFKQMPKISQSLV